MSSFTVVTPGEGVAGCEPARLHVQGSLQGVPQPLQVPLLITKSVIAASPSEAVQARVTPACSRQLVRRRNQSRG